MEVRRFRKEWEEASKLPLEEFKKDRQRKGDPTEWSYPITSLGIILNEITLLSMTPLDFRPKAPASLFS